MHRQDVPTVVLYNSLETFFGFLNRADDVSFVNERQYHGDRTLFWLNGAKLALVPAPVPHVQDVRQRWGYAGTEALAPENFSRQLSLDILREPRLVNRIVAHAGAARTVQLIPYVTTREFLQLAETLRAEYGLTVLLPESPAPERLWLRDYIDTKTGFRTLALQWLSNADLLPFGIIHHDMARVAEAAYWFNAQGQTCVIKPNNGVSGLGHIVLAPGDFCSDGEILDRLRCEPFLHDGLVVVEKYVHSSAKLSPSLELFVPPLGAGEPRVTYLSNQIFQDGHFAGVLISREQLEARWYPALEKSGLTIAKRLQQMGYVGHFDLDAIVDDQGHVYLLEVNARRTGGTFVHEFACFTFGLDYLNQVVLLGHNKLDSRGITSADRLLDVISDLLYPICSEPRGVVVTMTSTLKVGQFGCIFVAPSTEKVLDLRRSLLERFSDEGTVMGPRITL